ncbi:MAG TPA: bifunctional adenosylcobinamide kinase/adenosylcobinamide-phosphate guanylyltransferase [Acidimicrobiales bacterium]|nr:bifunctional adenosylcobinamide kinase/adenosylcobinamide-phosphate guanylyltransferase [Acidimicrobiales bacterium]
MDVATRARAEGTLTLVLGGTRSGKSEVAERLVGEQAGSDGEVTYVATGAIPTGTGDPLWEARVQAHRNRRPPRWDTMELGPGRDLGAATGTLAGSVLIDSLGGWVAGLEGFRVDHERLCADLRARVDTTGGLTVVVTEEVGLGVHPPTSIGVAFADALGLVNRRLAAVCDEVLLVVAGRVLALGGGR